MKKETWRTDVEDRTEIHGLPEWWDTYGEAYDGAWLIRQGRRARGRSVRALCLGRLLVVQVCVLCIRRKVRGEDAASHIAWTRRYVKALPIEEKELRALERVLATLLPFNPQMTAEELVGLTWSARRAGLDLAAHSCALLAYECALSCDAHDAAAAAAQALSDLARMHECPNSARRWRGRAFVHGRRAARAHAM